MTKYSVFDLETSNLYADSGAICSIGILVLDSKLEEISSFYSLVKEPGKRFSSEAMAINGINVDTLRDFGLPINPTLEIASKLLKDTIIVNHNSKFDCAWLNFRGFSIVESIDTLILSRRMWPGEKNNLKAVSERLGFSFTGEGAHNALSDCQMTAKVLRYFAKENPSWMKPEKIDFQKKER